uniref:Uncharacterized protein n=1 Tax=Solanum lycopersicum TaxID=4081 RepID=A0A3Q7GSA7_SOLLC
MFDIYVAKSYYAARNDGRKIALGHGTTAEEVTYLCFAAPRHLMGIDANEMLLTSLLTNYERKGQDIKNEQHIVS